MDNKEYGRGSKINIDEFINNNRLSVNDFIDKDFKVEIPKLLKEVEHSHMNFDEFYDKHFGYREQSTSVTDFYNKMKKYGLWD